jgi:hypothetical protein
MVGGDVRGHLGPARDEDLDHVGQVQLTLDVLRLQLLERRVSSPVSERPSEKAIEMAAPIDVASPAANA